MNARASAARESGAAGREHASAAEVTRRLLIRELGVARGQLELSASTADVEALHDYRVALRRARSLVGLTKGVWTAESHASLAAQLRALARPTGLCRDLDVQLESREDQLSALPAPLRAPGGAVFDRLEAVRDRERGRWAQDVQQWAALLDRILEDLQPTGGLPAGSRAGEPAVKLAVSALRKRYRTVRKRGGRLTEDSPVGEVHALRIACKKLRYLLELFAPQLGDDKGLRTLRKKLKRMQTGLGAFNDYCVQRELLLDRDWSDADAPTTLAAGTLVGLHTARLQELRRPIMKAVRKLNDPSLLRAVERGLPRGRHAV